MEDEVILLDDNHANKINLVPTSMSGIKKTKEQLSQEEIKRRRDALARARQQNDGLPGAKYSSRPPVVKRAPGSQPSGSKVASSRVDSGFVHHVTLGTAPRAAINSFPERTADVRVDAGNSAGTGKHFRHNGTGCTSPALKRQRLNVTSTSGFGSRTPIPGKPRAFQGSHRTTRVQSIPATVILDAVQTAGPQSRNHYDGRQETRSSHVPGSSMVLHISEGMDIKKAIEAKRIEALKDNSGKVNSKYDIVTLSDSEEEEEEKQQESLVIDEQSKKSDDFDQVLPKKVNQRSAESLEYKKKKIYKSEQNHKREATGQCEDGIEKSKENYKYSAISKTKKTDSVKKSEENIPLTTKTFANTESKEKTELKNEFKDKQYNTGIARASAGIDNPPKGENSNSSSDKFGEIGDKSIPTKSVQEESDTELNRLKKVSDKVEDAGCDDTDIQKDGNEKLHVSIIAENSKAKKTNEDKDVEGKASQMLASESSTSRVSAKSKINAAQENKTIEEIKETEKESEDEIDSLLDSKTSEGSERNSSPIFVEEVQTQKMSEILEKVESSTETPDTNFPVGKGDLEDGVKNLIDSEKSYKKSDKNDQERADFEKKKCPITAEQCEESNLKRKFTDPYTESKRQRTCEIEEAPSVIIEDSPSVIIEDAPSIIIDEPTTSKMLYHNQNYNKQNHITRTPTKWSSDQCNFDSLGPPAASSTPKRKPGLLENCKKPGRRVVTTLVSKIPGETSKQSIRSTHCDVKKDEKKMESSTSKVEKVRDNDEVVEIDSPSRTSKCLQRKSLVTELDAESRLREVMEIKSQNTTEQLSSKKLGKNKVVEKDEGSEIKSKECLNLFLKSCGRLLPGSEYLSVRTKLNKYFNQISDKSVRSPELANFIQMKRSLLEADSKNIYVQIRDVMNELKEYRGGKTGTTSSDNNLPNPPQAADRDKGDDPRDVIEKEKEPAPGTSGYGQNQIECEQGKKKKAVSSEHINKLQRALRQCAKEIDRLENAEIDFDDEQNSVYIMQSKYKKRYMDIYRRLAQYQNSQIDLQRQEDKNFKFEESKFPEINVKISKFVNRKKEFPDFIDIKDLVRECGSKFGWTDGQVHSEAEKIFQAVGKKLIKRRRFDEYDYSSSYVKEAVDPARVDQCLDSKLRMQTQEGKKRIDKVLQEFVDKQLTSADDRKGEDEGDGSSEAEEEEGEEEENEEDEMDDSETIGSSATGRKSPEEEEIQDKDHEGEELGEDDEDDFLNDAEDMDDHVEDDEILDSEPETRDGSADGGSADSDIEEIILL